LATKKNKKKLFFEMLTLIPGPSNVRRREAGQPLVELRQRQRPLEEQPHLQGQCTYICPKILFSVLELMVEKQLSNRVLKYSREILG
jgi:hypothetical protein